MDQLVRRHFVARKPPRCMGAFIVAVRSVGRAARPPAKAGERVLNGTHASLSPQTDCEAFPMLAAHFPAFRTDRPSSLGRGMPSPRPYGGRLRAIHPRLKGRAFPVPLFSVTSSEPVPNAALLLLRLE